MPNWCTNRLEITGDSEQLTKYLEDSTIIEDGSERFSFNGVVPTPDDITNTDSPSRTNGTETEEEHLTKMADLTARYGATNWYDWHIKYWGTKWDATNIDIEDSDEHCINIAFDTAWGPPNKYVLAASIKFPALQFNLWYEEGGCGFTGDFEVKNGEILLDDCRDIIYYELLDKDDNNLNRWDTELVHAECEAQEILNDTTNSITYIKIIYEGKLVKTVGKIRLDKFEF